MTVGEVLKLSPNYIQDPRVIMRDPKSGKGAEPVLVPHKVAERLK